MNFCAKNRHLRQAASWYKQNIIDLATVSFPGKPDSIDNSGMPSYQYVEDSAIYIVQTNKLSTSKVEIINSSIIDTVYSGIITGIIKNLNATLISKRIFELNNKKVLDFDIQIINPNKPNIATFRVMYYNSTVLSYTFMYFSSDNSSHTSEKKSLYFSSIVPTQLTSPQKTDPF
jgi:hypothetical protein